MKRSVIVLLLLILGVSCTQKGVFREVAQDEGAALAYMDRRAKDWLSSMSANGKPCLSCHTSVPYAMVRTAHGQTEETKKMKEIIDERVQFFKEKGFIDGDEVRPWYELNRSYSTESVVNASTLVFMEVGENADELSESSKLALEMMWERQEKSGDLKGGFQWLDQFDMGPFENKNSGYWGTALGGVAVGQAPGDYAKGADIKNNINEMKKYLKNNFDDQTLHNKLMAAWADVELGGGILSETQKKELIKEIAKTQLDDGGFSIHRMMGQNASNIVSDGYATGFVTNIMMKMGYKNNTVKDGMKYIRSSQQVRNTGVLPNGNSSCGSWLGTSVQSGTTSLFMTDISTSYSILSLRTAAKLGL